MYDIRIRGDENAKERAHTHTNEKCICMQRQTEIIQCVMLASELVLNVSKININKHSIIYPRDV